jgi:tetratricopeptide (TPR) repeat protein
MTEKAAIFERRRQQKLSPGDEIRAGLSQLETQLAQAKTLSRAEAVELLKAFDRTYDLLAEYARQTPNPYPAEMSRFETAKHTAERHASDLLRAIGGAQALQEERQPVSPEPERSWWNIDGIVEEKRKTLQKRIGRGAAVAAAVIVIVVGVYKAFLEPPESVKQTVSHSYQADDLIFEGDLEGALDEVEIALSYSPDSLELLVKKGVLLEALGKQVREASVDEESFLIERGFAYLSLQKPEAALADAEAVLAINPESAQGLFIAGACYETLGDITSALDAYEKAAAAAEKEGDFTMVATIRMRTASLLDSGPIIEPTATPE